LADCGQNLDQGFGAARLPDKIFCLSICAVPAKVSRPFSLFFSATNPKLQAHIAKIVGIEGMNPQQLANELQSGARFVQYQYCVSALVITFKRGTDIYFIPAGESRAVKGSRGRFLLLWQDGGGFPGDQSTLSNHCG
jgi:hypothetical protein